MADEPDHPRDVDDDIDPADLDRVTRALHDLDFLRPDVAAEPMPDWVWHRITDSLAAELPAGPARRPSRLLRWGGGLVAASVAVLAVGVAVTAFQNDGSGGAVVAGDAVPTSQQKVDTAEEDSAGVAEAVAAPEALAAPAMMSFAGMVPPALRLVDSKTDYTPSALSTQVSEVLQAFDAMPSPAEAASEPAPDEVPMPDAPADGFLSSPESLRDCITKLTAEEDSTALIVDRSTFEGQDAGVVVAADPVAEAAATEASDPETAALAATNLEVWVIDRDCDVRMKISLRVMR